MPTNDKVKVAAVQMEPRITEVKSNLDNVIAGIRTAADSNAKLVVFPECALTGYIFSSREEAMIYAETIPGPATDKLQESCRELGVYAIVGLLEKSGQQCFNAAVLVGPEGIVGKYHKSHMSPTGADCNFDLGTGPFEVYRTPIGNIGILICYDCTFPEASRILALSGADIIAIPTNWPEGREKVPQYLLTARAYENKVHIVAADRVGRERGIKFIGLSKIIDARGDTLASANGEDEQIIYGEVSLIEAREKRIVLKPGEIELNFIGDRRPGLYSKITEP